MAITSERAAVRGPFRAMGAAIAVLGALTLPVLGYRYLFERPPQLHTSDLVAIPGMLWVIRACWFAARTGRAPREFPSWPFATEGVLGVYCALSFVLWWFGR
jgi:hypothetical protein